ncbi:hypothetical protein BDY24DRAFT_417620 [Mrakia frigida]|uniref:uncharacterized protein n=1 Tax=Mrakia frigida TaxID=29902 RepID=UPI003FCBFFBF
MLELLLVVVLAILVMLLTFLFAAAFVMPIAGSITRLRANYIPKGVRLDEEAGKTGPLVVRSVWGMIKRVKNLEGWKGLYKGISPVIALDVLIGVSIAIVAFVANAITGAPTDGSAATAPGGLSLIVAGLGAAFFTLPFTVLINRSIVTPHLLSWNPMKAGRIILTPFERSRPWVLFKAPGLLVVTFVQVAWMAVVSKGVKTLLLPEIVNFGSPETKETPYLAARLAVFVAFQLLSTFLICPLSVLAVRLSIQRQNNGQTPVDQIPSEYAGKEEDVLVLRSEEQPYDGAMDALKTIIHEEGWQALYTAWMPTMFGLLVGMPL